MLEKIAEQFRKPSGFLGKVIAFVMAKGNMSAYRYLLDELPQINNGKILEIGYGPGLGLKIISEKYNTSVIYGIDFSELMYQKASVLNKNKIAQNKIQLSYGNFIDYQSNGNDFDLILCLNVVYFWDDLMIPFQKIHSLLKENGKYSFYMAHAEQLNKLKFTKEVVFNKYTIEQVTSALKTSGFTEVMFTYKNGYFIHASK